MNPAFLRPGHPLTRLLVPIVSAALALAGVALAQPAQAAGTGNPVGFLDQVSPVPTGILVSGWAADPSSVPPIQISVSVDSVVVGAVTANLARADVGRAYPNFGPDHGFSSRFIVTSGRHTVCVSAVNVGPGATVSLGCKPVVAAVDPIGHVDVARQSVGGVVLSGWAFDPDSVAPVSLTVTDAGRTVATASTGGARGDVARAYRLAGANRGFSVTLPITTPGAHLLCAVATNIASGATPTSAIGCITMTYQVNPIGNLHGIPRPSGSTSITVNGWALDPESAGPVTVQLVVDGSTTVSTLANIAAPALVVPYLGVGVNHVFNVTIPVDYSGHSVCATALNVGQGTNVFLGCQSSPSLLVPIGPVTTPALISTSRYIRDIHGGPADVTTTRSMGATDAGNNPANHKYLMLLQIGGQTTTGIILSATSTFVTYAQTVTALESYIDGYASTQKVNAPATIAIGTNNDVDVRAATGIIWAQQLINPLRTYARKYPYLTIAGANDIEPGFIATVAQSQDWLSGYLRATLGEFVFNGSADGCGWTTAFTTCNNGWNAAALAWLSGAAAPTRIISLPQIYNYTMPEQWKYISLTNVIGGKQKINFAGPLTEWTACYTQNSGCGSLTNNNAWTALWTQLNSDPRVSQPSLPYGTDLRIN